jgi:hypothetical protein
MAQKLERKLGKTLVVKARETAELQPAVMSDQLCRSERARSCDIRWLNATESIALSRYRNGLVRMLRVTVPG